MTGLSTVDDDVLAIILQTLHDSSRNSLFSLLRTSRRLYEAALPFVFHQTTVNFAEKEMCSRITSWFDDQIVLKSIRSLTVVLAYPQHLPLQPPPPHPPPSVPPSYGSPVTGDEHYSPLVELLSALRALNEFTFACPTPLPLALLEALHEYQPQVRFHIKQWTRISQATPFGDPVELTLAQSPVLRSLHSSAWFGFQGINLQYQAFMRIVALAPNLESFHFETKSLHRTFDVIPITSVADFEEQVRQTKLFEVRSPIKKVIKSIHLGTTNSSSPALLDGLPFVDWSRLHTLSGVTFREDFTRTPFDGSLFPSLKSLQVRFELGLSQSPVFNTFCSLHSLESLSIIDGIAWLSLELLLAHHGQTLRTLHIHQFETLDRERPRLTLGVQQLIAIRDACPFLEDFSIDVDRTKSRDKERTIYNLLATFNSLRNLTINLDLGLFTLDYNRWTEPGPTKEHQKIRDTTYSDLDHAMVRVIWKGVGGHTPTSKLEKLIIEVGEHGVRRGPILPAAWVIEEARRRTKFVLTRNERDDRKQDVFIDEFPKWRPVETGNPSYPLFHRGGNFLF